MFGQPRQVCNFGCPNQKLQLMLGNTRLIESLTDTIGYLCILTRITDKNIVLHSHVFTMLQKYSKQRNNAKNLI